MTRQFPSFPFLSFPFLIGGLLGGLTLLLNQLEPGEVIKSGRRAFSRYLWRRPCDMHSQLGLGSALPIISNRRNLTRRVHGMYTGKEMAALWLTTGQETAATVAMHIVLGGGDTLWFSRFREKK